MVWYIRRRDAVSVTAREAHTTRCLPTPPLASTPVEHLRLRASPETGIRSVYVSKHVDVSVRDDS